MSDEHQGHHTPHHAREPLADQPGGGQEHHSHHNHDQMVADFRRRFWVSLILTGPVLVLAPMIQQTLGLDEVLAFPGDGFVQFALATAVFFYGGWPFLKGMIGEVGRRRPGMMTLIALAITVAYSYSSVVVFGVPGEVFFWELATLIDIMLLGHWIEMRSIMGASRALEELVRLMPSEAHRVMDDGEIEEVAVSELAHGDRVVVKPGEKIPTDGLILDGRTTVNQAMLTGESMPVEKGEGEQVIGGSVNGEWAFTFEVQNTGKDTYLSQVIGLVREAQESRSRSQDLANRAALWLTVIAISVGVITFVAWLALGQGVNFALERMVTVMVIACPHALGLAVPLVVAVSTALSASHGLLVRDRSAFERARGLQAVVFDKSGTLTEGRFGVTDVISLGSIPEAEILRLAAGLESRSEHPIAEGIVRQARHRGRDGCGDRVGRHRPHPLGSEGCGLDCDTRSRDVQEDETESLVGHCLQPCRHSPRCRRALQVRSPLVPGCGCCPDVALHSDRGNQCTFAGSGGKTHR